MELLIRFHDFILTFMTDSTKRSLYIILIPACCFMAGIFYYWADPQESVIMPKCIMKLITGYQCPSCGTQRSLHALLHGHLTQALRYNYFFIISIPLFVIAMYAFWGIKKNNPSKTIVSLYNFVTNRYTLICYIILFFVWWVLRNVIGC